MKALPITTINDLKTIGREMALSGMVGADNESQGFAIASILYQRSMDVLEFQRRYNVIHGNIGNAADAMLADFEAAGGTYRILSRDADEASVQIEFRDRKRTFTLKWIEVEKEDFVWTYEIDQSAGKKLKKLKIGWRTPRGRMQRLWARVISDAIRCMAPGVNFGMYTPEEIEDFDDNDSSHSTVDQQISNEIDREPNTIEGNENDQVDEKENNEGNRNDKTPPAELPMETLSGTDETDYSVIPEFEMKQKDGSMKQSPISGQKFSDQKVASLQYFLKYRDRFEWLSDGYAKHIEGLLR